MKKLLILPLLIALAACQPQKLAEYRPVVDPAKSNPAKFEQDLTQCRAVATQAEANYKTRASNQAAQQAVAGAIIGGLLGAALGNSNTAAAGAAYGIGTGATAVDYEQQYGGPRRIIDRCMTDRGHTILNDIGKG